MPQRIIAPALMFLAVFAACIVSIAALSCGGTTNCSDPKNGSSAACVAQTALLECAGTDVSGVISQYTPVVEQIIQGGLNADGTINYATIEGDLVTAVAKYGWCVVSSVFDHYIHPSSVATGSGSGGLKVTSGPKPTPDAAKNAFDKLRTKVAPQLKVHTAGGTL
jgi:hypothetical protein